MIPYPPLKLAKRYQRGLLPHLLLLPILLDPPTPTPLTPTRLSRLPLLPLQALRLTQHLSTQQSRIDTIVATIPSTSAHHSHSGSNESSSDYHRGYLGGSTPSGGGGPIHRPPQRRNKVYCDKWVHEGVCAFTQQGCKYKHEMPFDKATQHALGLFHGLPAWWKKHQADLARQQDVSHGMRLEGLSESGNGKTYGETGTNEETSPTANKRMNRAFGSNQHISFGGAAGAATPKAAWREQSEQTQHGPLVKHVVEELVQDVARCGAVNTSGGPRGGFRGGISGLWFTFCSLNNKHPADRFKPPSGFLPPSVP